MCTAECNCARNLSLLSEEHLGNDPASLWPNRYARVKRKIRPQDVSQERILSVQAMRFAAATC